MKRTILIILALCALRAFADSSESMAPSIWARPENQDSGSTTVLTPFIGLAAMNVKGAGASSTWRSDTGVSAGALAEFGHGYVTFQTGALYNQFGAKASDNETSVTLNLTYLSIPATAKFNLMGNSQQTVYLKAGVMPGILVSRDITATNGASGTMGDVSSVDLPAVLALGGAIPAGAGSFIVEANYLRSLTNINTGDGGTIRNEGFIIGAGFSIPL